MRGTKTARSGVRPFHQITARRGNGISSTSRNGPRNDELRNVSDLTRQRLKLARLPTLARCYPRSFYVDHSHCLVLAPATLAALPSTRAIPNRGVFYVAHPTRSIRSSRPPAVKFAPANRSRYRRQHDSFHREPIRRGTSRG